MAWLTPKTDWIITDRFNIQDYNRIKGNLEFLHERAERLHHKFPIRGMGSDKADYSVFFYADEFNLFEENLDIINQSVFMKNYGQSQSFFDNGPFIRWDELNRIESAVLEMNSILDRQEAGLKRLAFRLGNIKGVAV